jgi:tetratricopeptide (TPR) repeat protein
MDYVKQTLFLFLLCTLFSFPALAQQSLSDAFKASYESENTGNLDQAIEALDAVYDSDSYELNLRLGWLHYQHGEMEQSIHFYQRAVNLKPYAIEPKLGLAYPYSAMARWDDIIELYNEILETDPQNSLVNYRLGLIYYNRGEYERADFYIEKTVNLYPFDYDSLLLFAWNKLMMQRTREAKVLFEKVLLVKPGDESAMTGLSLIQ